MANGKTLLPAYFQPINHKILSFETDRAYLHANVQTHNAILA